MNKIEIFPGLFREIEKIVSVPGRNRTKLEKICRLIKDQLPGYDWVGFYLVSSDKERQLILGPFAGEPTEHTLIAFGQGICGQAAETEKTFIVDDVSRESNYLSCSLNVRSEIVVPLFKNGHLVGELDIDSHTPAAFTRDDERFLERVGEIAAGLI